jgi:hypothetical protein
MESSVPLLCGLAVARDSGAKIFEIRLGQLTFPRLGGLWACR